MRLARALSVLSLLVWATGASTGTAQEQDYETARKSLEADLARPRPHRLEINKGKGYVLCETLLKTARRLHPNGLYRPLQPVLTWKEIFSIRGMIEPPWTELDPLQHEALFARVHELYEITRSTSYSRELNQVDAFFARHRYMSPLCPGGGKCNLPLEERRPITLEGYRDFAKSGGRMRMYPADIGSREFPFPVALIQYEYGRYPDWWIHRRTFEQPEWLGFTFYAKPDLSDRIVGDAQNTVQVGPNRRLMLYRGRPHVAEIDTVPYLLAMHVPWPNWQCEISLRDIEPQR